MRKLILTVLLASSVAMPAMAQDRGDRHHDRGQNATSQGDESRVARRAERSERTQAERPQVAARPNWSARGEARQQGADVEQRRQQWQQRFSGEQRGSDQQVTQQQQVEQRRAWSERRSRIGGFSNVQPQQPATNPDERVRDGRRAGSDGRDWRGRDGSQYGQDQSRSGRLPLGRVDEHRYQRSGSTRQWSHQWRNDRNYDWRHYRDRNRSVFRLGNYYDPYGSRYRRFSIGFSLFPSYYQSNFWLDDPWMYRLPPAYGPYRWVRYYDDALLVNIYTGQVADVIYSFFW